MSTEHPLLLVQLANEVDQDIIGDQHTLRAFTDHGETRPTLDADPDAAQRTLAEARDAGIDLAAVTAELEREGIRSFCDSHHQLIESIDTKLISVTAAGGSSRG